MKQVLLSTIILFCFSTISFATTNSIGAGFILGDPSGLTAKFFIHDADALDLGLGESADCLYIYADYLRHFHSVFPISQLVLYVGVGSGFHNFEKDNKNTKTHENRIDVRIPFGIEYTFSKVPIGIFLEIVPSLRVVPDIDFDIRGGLGARYYF